MTKLPQNAGLEADLPGGSGYLRGGDQPTAARPSGGALRLGIEPGARGDPRSNPDRIRALSCRGCTGHPGVNLRYFGRWSLDLPGALNPPSRVDRTRSGSRHRSGNRWAAWWLHRRSTSAPSARIGDSTPPWALGPGDRHSLCVACRRMTPACSPAITMVPFSDTPNRQRGLRWPLNHPPLEEMDWSACGWVPRPGLTQMNRLMSLGLSLVRSVGLARSPTRLPLVGRSDLIGACLTQARRCPVRRPAGAVSPQPNPTKG